MIKWGLISDLDGQVLMKTFDIICKEWNDEIISICEIGLYNCGSSIGLMNYYWQNHITDIKSINYIGIDNCKDKPVENIPDWMNFINGNSNEVYNQISDESQHLIFIDGCHTFPAVVSDYYCYAPKVKIGGFLAFHDTGKHLDPLSGWQGVGDKNDPDFCLGGVRKALKEIGLLDEFLDGTPKFELIFDEADVNDTGGGICVFKKLY